MTFVTYPFPAPAVLVFLSFDVASLFAALSTLLVSLIGGYGCGEDPRVIMPFGGFVTYATTICIGRYIAFVKIWV